MIFVISPAKNLDTSEESRFTQTYSQPAHLDDAQKLVNILAKKSSKSLGKLMHISDNLAALNHERYQSYHTPFHTQNAKQALFTFKGDVYLSFDLEEYTDDEFSFAQRHLRILSGLYGLLKPLDLIQPYRLEMGTSLKNRRGKDLYAFWGDRIAKGLNEALQSAGDETLINLASNEYFKSANRKSLKANVITPVFKDEKNGKLKVISFFAKKARGAMCDFAIKEKITKAEALKDFKGLGYQYDTVLSSKQEWVFTRPESHS
ncbi:MAG: peroxide stress protein YaaA [Bacteroidota bacterium]